jgi:hypothetical protein
MKLTDKPLNIYIIYLQIGIYTDLPADEGSLKHVPYLLVDSKFVPAIAKKKKISKNLYILLINTCKISIPQISIFYRHSYCLEEDSLIFCRDTLMQITHVFQINCLPSIVQIVNYSVGIGVFKPSARDNALCSAGQPRLSIKSQPSRRNE